ncbi:hypothetical protein GCM10023169_34390 [Georgenia halophila]|uniref:CBM-cenC domain-containing protein n=1 Tax=Georgenia halophila TaxID=620889 RepID=A0ABP8LLS3_9MICO
MTSPLSIPVAAAVAGVLALLPSTAATGAADAESEPGNLLANHSFEQVDDQGQPLDWSPVWASSAVAFSTDDGDASDGERSLRILDDSSGAGYGLAAEPVPVEAGQSYAYGLDLNFSGGTLQPTVYFLDANGERVGQESTTLSPDPGSWESSSFTMVAPAGAVEAQPLVYSSISATADGLVDNVRFGAELPEEAPGVEESLGEPIGGITNAGAGYTQNAEGRDIGVVVAGGSPSKFSAVDLVTGERLMTETIEGSTLTWAYATTPDRQVYLATASGQVFRFDPDALTLTRIADKPFGERYFWEAGSNAEGEVFFATYPGGKILGYDPVTDEWQDFGTMVEGNQYARSLAVDGDDVYVGGGTTASLVHLDTATRETTRIELPAEHTDEEFVYDVSVAGDTVFARTTPANTIHVYSVTEGAWVDTITDAVGLDVSPVVQTSDSGTVRQEVLVPKIGGGMVAYDLDTRERRSVSVDLGGASARGWSVQEIDLADFPGASLVTATSKAVFHVWNPQTGQTRHVRSDAAPTPFLIRSLGTGPDGNVYAGGYASPPGIARVDAATGETELLRGPSQTEDMVAHGDHLVAGTYPGGRLYVYDTTEAWQNGTNPAAPITIGHGQDRPVAFASAGDVVAVGSVPDYGHLGGALSLLDPDSGELTVLPELIEDQTILSLAYRDGLVYGGTGIWGGLGTEPTTDEGQLFVFDPASQEVVHLGTPVPGEENISALTFDDDGMLWGMTANGVFQVDPATMEVVRQQRYFDVDDSGAYWTTRELFWHHGTLVGQTAGRLFEIDPATMEMTTLQTGVQNLAIDRLGNYYYNRGGTLYRWVPAEPMPRCDETFTGTHEGPVRIADGVMCLEDADVEGPVSVAAGASLVVSRGSIEGPLTAEGATTVQLRSSEVTGPVSIHGSTGAVVVSDSTVEGPLRCTGNAQQPTDEGKANTIGGPSRGQCADL